MSRRKLFSHIHRAWRLFPKNIRRRAFQATTTFLAQPPLAHAAPLPPVTVCGPLSSSIGIGWGARENLAMLESAGFDTRRLDVADSILFARDLPDVRAANSSPAAVDGPGTFLIHANPPQLPYLFLRLGRQITRPKYVIGYCVWELPRIPANWRRPLRLVHRIWCPSTFSARAFAATSEKPVDVVPHAIEPDRAARTNREKFGLPANAFTVLTAVHLASGLARKNPLAAIRAFKIAFGASDKAFLLVKVSQGDIYPDRLATVEREIAGAPNIRVLEETLGDHDYWSLLHSVDAVLSLHRSEGFGLVIAQAMALGKPAIATGWSGNMDYMTPKNSLPVRYTLVPVVDDEENYREPDQSWADPDVEHAAALLRQAAADPDLMRGIGRAARQSITAKLSRKAVTDILGQRLSELGLTQS